VPASPSPLQLSIVIPTFNESENIRPLTAALASALAGISYEVLFVDDASPDGTAQVIRSLAAADPRVRILERSGRRGLSSACLEGISNTRAPYIAVMDADLQHDESILPRMLATVESGHYDLVVATRNAPGGSMGPFTKPRVALSKLGLNLSRAITQHPLSDPMSGFFLINRTFFEEVRDATSGIGFKILLDLVTSSRRPLAIAEVPYRFRARLHGESKLNVNEGLEYLHLIATKLPLANGLFLCAALLWLVLAFPNLGTRYSYDWDSSQFARGAQHFDIALHQPHPPGYPLWILAMRGVLTFSSHPYGAQVLLAFLFTLAALIFFHSLAGELLGRNVGHAASALLAFSPLVLVYAITPLNYAVDLLASCAIAWFSARLWSGRHRWAIPACAFAGATAGFRPSGVTFLLPLLAIALLRCARRRPIFALLGVLTGLLCEALWYVPTALLTGGFQALSVLNSAQFLSSVAKTSVFFGAPPMVHLTMLAEVTIYFALALAAFAMPVVVSLCSKRAPVWERIRPAWANPTFFTLWLAPNLAFLYLIHCGKPGYVLLSLPPLVLLAAGLARPALVRPVWACTAIATALIAGYFPYERLINRGMHIAPYLYLRASPRMAGLSQIWQQELRNALDSLPGSPQEKRIVCLHRATEAPNIRTVTYDFAGFQWSLNDDSPAGWLCDAGGLPADVRAQYPNARRIYGNELYSLWADSAPAVK
jgi:glycosyltransferase involved in cell wall biosynthesis